MFSQYKKIKKEKTERFNILVHAMPHFFGPQISHVVVIFPIVAI